MSQEMTLVERGMLITLLQKQAAEIKEKLDAVGIVIDMVEREEKLAAIKIKNKHLNKKQI